MSKIKGKIMFIDIHAHAYRLRPYRVDNGNWVGPEELLAFYDKHNIEAGVLMPIVSPECNCVQACEDILEMAEKYKGRFIPFCNLDPRAVSNDAHSPLEKVLLHYKECGCCGVGEITANLSFFDPKMRNLMRAAEIAKLPLTFHIAHRNDGCYGIVDAPGLPGLTESLVKYPNLIFFGHSVGFWSEISEMETPMERFLYPTGKVREGVVPKLMRLFPNLMGDLSAGSGANALMRDPEYAVKFLNEFQDRLCFGMDICLDPTDNNARLAYFLIKLRDEGKISDTVFRKVARENALRILGLQQG